MCNIEAGLGLFLSAARTMAVVLITKTQYSGLKDGSLLDYHVYDFN